MTASSTLRPRLLHVITGLATGGAEMMLARLAVQLATEFDQSVISLTQNGSAANLLTEAGIPVKVLGMSIERPNPLLLFRLAKWMRTFRPDIVQTWLYHADLVGGLAACLARAPAVVWNIRSNELPADTTKPRTRWVLSACAAMSHRVPDRVVCCSQAAVQTHVEAGYDLSKFVLIPNGFDLARLRPDPTARVRLIHTLGVPEESRIVGNVARFDPFKDHETMFRAAASVCARLPTTYFVMIGRGMDNSNASLKRLLDRCGLGNEVRLLGERSDVPDIMTGFDLMCSSSVSEGFQNTLAEAMACGAPCIATDVGDAHLIVGDTGWVVPRRDPAALANALIEALTLTPHDLHEIGRRARKRVETNFDLALAVRRYADLYRSLL
jgi:glycosyltransferase involved in cell wall biosynthesis